MGTWLILVSDLWCLQLTRSAVYITTQLVRLQLWTSLSDLTWRKTYTSRLITLSQRLTSLLPVRTTSSLATCTMLDALKPCRWNTLNLKRTLSKHRERALSLVLSASAFRLRSSLYLLNYLWERFPTVKYSTNLNTRSPLLLISKLSAALRAEIWENSRPSWKNTKTPSSLTII